jgi:hypothetical protein
VGRFRKRWFGHLVESEDGFTVEVIHPASFPEVTIRYKDGPHTMNVFSEEQFKVRHLQLYRSSMAHWEPPYASEALDDAARQTVLDCIIAALSYAGYVIEPVDSVPS